MGVTRRKFLQYSGGTGIVLSAPFWAHAWTNKSEPYDRNSFLENSRKMLNNGNADLTQNEDFWFGISQSYTPAPNILNLNNGGVSPQPKTVQEVHQQFLKKANEIPSYQLFSVFAAERESVRTKLAGLAGADPEEIAINRNSSEGLETIIFGLHLNKGDEVLTTNQDYPNMMSAWRQRERRDGIKLNTISVPVPCDNPAEITERFRKAITPNTKVIHCSHMINLTGQILPIREICDMAHEKGIEVIVDGAHTFAQFEFKIPDLHCDYFATSLHKWLCAPFGTGMMWIKKDKIKNIWPLLGAPKETPETDIRKFEHLGTRSFAAELSISEAIHFHEGIGSKRKESRLRYLKNYWAEKVATIPKVKLNTSLKAECSCALANFTIQGMEPGEIFKQLFDTYKIYSTPIGHDEFKGVRITPHVYTTLTELDYFVNAVNKIAKG